MEVKLTDMGRTHLQKSGDVDYVTVSIDRAFHMMMVGLAVPDQSFMSLYAANNPKPKAIPEIEPERPKKTRKKTEKRRGLRENETI